jgi:hypothetical protein
VGRITAIYGQDTEKPYTPRLELTLNIWTLTKQRNNLPPAVAALSQSGLPLSGQLDLFALPAAEGGVPALPIARGAAAESSTPPNLMGGCAAFCGSAPAAPIRPGAAAPARPSALPCLAFWLIPLVALLGGAASALAGSAGQTSHLAQAGIGTAITTTGPPLATLAPAALWPAAIILLAVFGITLWLAVRKSPRIKELFRNFLPGLGLATASTIFTILRFLMSQAVNTVTRTRDGRPLSPRRAHRLARIIRLIEPLMRFFRVVLPAKAVGERLSRSAHASLVQALDEAQSSRRIRAGPWWLFWLLDFLQIPLFAFRTPASNWIILNPWYSHEYSRSIVHELTEQVSFSHEDAERICREVFPYADAPHPHAIRYLRYLDARQLIEETSNWADGAPLTFRRVFFKGLIEAVHKYRATSLWTTDAFWPRGECDFDEAMEQNGFYESGEFLNFIQPYLVFQESGVCHLLNIEELKRAPGRNNKSAWEYVELNIRESIKLIVTDYAKKEFWVKDISPGFMEVLLHRNLKQMPFFLFQRFFEVAADMCLIFVSLLIGVVLAALSLEHVMEYLEFYLPAAPEIFLTRKWWVILASPFLIWASTKLLKVSQRFEEMAEELTKPYFLEKLRWRIVGNDTNGITSYRQRLIQLMADGALPPLLANIYRGFLENEPWVQESLAAAIWLRTTLKATEDIVALAVVTDI